MNKRQTKKQLSKKVKIGLAAAATLAGGVAVAAVRKTKKAAQKAAPKVKRATKTIAKKATAATKKVVKKARSKK